MTHEPVGPQSNRELPGGTAPKITWGNALFYAAFEMMLITLVSVAVVSLFFDPQFGGSGMYAACLAYDVMLAVFLVPTRAFLTMRGLGTFQRPEMAMRSRLNMLFSTALIVLGTVVVRAARGDPLLGPESVGLIVVTGSLAAYAFAYSRRLPPYPLSYLEKRRTIYQFVAFQVVMAVCMLVFFVGLSLAPRSPGAVLAITLGVFALYVALKRLIFRRWRRTDPTL